MLRTVEGGPRISEKDVVQFERQLGVRLPEQYRSFLIERNGGRPELDVFDVPGGSESNSVVRIHVFFAIGDPEESCDLAWNIAESEEDDIPDGLIPIATSEGADMIYLDVRGSHQGWVFFWDGYQDNELKKLIPVATTFEEFLGNLRREEDSPEFELS